MAYRKINLLTELSRLARNQETSMPPERIAEWALPFVKASLESGETARLERLFRLEDPRG